MKRPHVLAVSFFSTQGPVADNFHMLAMGLAANAQLRVLTTPVLEGRPVPGADITYVPVVKQRPTSWISPRHWRTIWRVARSERYDLLFIYSEHPLHYPVSRLARARRRLFWCLDPHPHSDATSLLESVYEASKRALIRHSDRVVVACDALVPEVVDRYRVARERVFASYHGALANLVFPDIGGAERDIDVLFFGRLTAYKGLDVLWDAVRLMGSNGHRPRVHVVGPGDEAPAPIPGITVANRYHPDRELAGLVARSRIVVMPYRDATGTQVPQTAFVYGTPVVASRVGCLGEYVEDGVTGLLVPPGSPPALANALATLLDDAGLWERFSQAARSRVRDTFASERLTRELLETALTDRPIGS